LFLHEGTFWEREEQPKRNPVSVAARTKTQAILACVRYVISALPFLVIL
jgi:hypothetical protein